MVPVLLRLKQPTILSLVKNKLYGGILWSIIVMTSEGSIHNSQAEGGRDSSTVNNFLRLDSQGI